MNKSLNVEFEDCEKGEKEIICKAKLPEQCKAEGNNILCKIKIK